MYDIHISAMRIGDVTPTVLGELGFRLDHFENCKRCAVVLYHSTYDRRLREPDDALWTKVCGIISGDAHFSGIVEEEQILRQHNFRRGPTTGDPETKRLEALPISECPAGVHKACDVHVRVLPGQAPESALALLEGLEVSSFDRPRNGAQTRVYTATFESESQGSRYLDILVRLLEGIGTDGGQAKIERTTRFLRNPGDAITLPIVRADVGAAWIDRASRTLNLKESDFVA